MVQTTFFPDDSLEVNFAPVNVASVPQRSPFRYPGGKTWFVPLLRKWLKSLDQRPSLLIEPFAGGGIISLTAAFESLAEKVIMVELDQRVSAVWETILKGHGDWLADKILRFDLTPCTARSLLVEIPSSVRELAFQTVVRNRTSHGGILADGAGVIKEGENGRGILSRWYPKTLSNRIRAIQQVADRIHFIQGDAFDVFEKYMDVPEAAYFIDPPYTAGGKKAGSRLYTHSQIDHDKLFLTCARSCGNFLLTYDNASEVKELATKYGFETRPIAMKNTHHVEMSELLIGRDLSWMD